MQDYTPSSEEQNQPTKHPEAAKPAPLKPLWEKLKKLHIPALGPTGTVVGVIGLFIGTLALGLVVAIVMRAIISGDALNPFQEGNSDLAAEPNATPNPDFLAPTVDLGNAPVWQGTDRVTILLMGGDRRPGETRSRPLTDTMMLLMIDPETQVASILSIPRDLYVEIPGYGLNRINTAYVLGGPDLAIETVQYNFGIRVNHYALVEFAAFTTFIDEIGGIDIYVPYDISDPSYPDMNYGYDPFYISAGQHHMDGETALKYARTRHTNDSDFGRAQRQQDVIFAIRDKVISLDMLTTLIQRAPALYAALSQHIQTDLTLDQMISLARLAEDVPREFIRTGVVGAGYVSNYTTDTGAQVLIPNRAQIGILLAEVFWLNEPPAADQ